MNKMKKVRDSLLKEINLRFEREKKNAKARMKKK
jgi:hypothetical protein